MATRGEAIAQGLLGSFTMGVGQFCTKPGLVFALRGADTDKFIAALGKAVEASAPGTMLTEDIRVAFEKHRGDVVGVAGVSTLATAGAKPGVTQALPSVARTDGESFLQHPQLATEAFGPFSLVIVVDDLEQMAACARVLDGQLTATLHGTDADLMAWGAIAADVCTSLLVVMNALRLLRPDDAVRGMSLRGNAGMAGPVMAGAMIRDR
jgi:NADP-dependent aldehyde dehydrogenase